MSNSEKQLALTTKIFQTIEAAEPKFNQIARKTGNLVLFEQECQFAKQAVEKNYLLQRCDLDSIKEAIINLASIGLSLNPVEQHCALIPRWNKNVNGYSCYAEPMYRGLIAIATADNVVVRVNCEVVRERDIEDGNFSMDLGTSPKIFFTPNPFMNEATRGDIVGAFCIAELPNAKHPHITFMGIEDLLKARDASETWKAYQKKKISHGGPWQAWPAEMMKKTVAKRAQKLWPKSSTRLRQAIALANQAEGHDDEPVIEATAVETISKEQANELRQLARNAKIRVQRIYDRFSISKVEELPKKDFEACRTSLLRGLLVRKLREGTNEDHLYADEWGLTLKELEGLAAMEKSMVRLWSSKKAREPDHG